MSSTFHRLNISLWYWISGTFHRWVSQPVLTRFPVLSTRHLSTRGLMWRPMQMIAELAFTGSAKKRLRKKKRFFFKVVLVMICLLHFFSFLFNCRLISTKNYQSLWVRNRHLFSWSFYFIFLSFCRTLHIIKSSLHINKNNPWQKCDLCSKQNFWYSIRDARDTFKMKHGQKRARRGNQLVKQ